MDGIPALELWDLVIEVLHSSSTKHKDTMSKRGETCSVTDHQANTTTPKSRLKFNTI